MCHRNWVSKSFTFLRFFSHSQVETAALLTEASSRGIIEDEDSHDVLHTLDSMHQQGLPVSQDDISHLVHGCNAIKDLAAGRSVHIHLVSHGLDTFSTLGDHLIRLFASSRCLLEANLVFCKVWKPSIYTWHAIILAHANSGRNDLALELYQQMQREGIMPNRFIFTSALKACECIGSIRMIHDVIATMGLDSDLVVGSTLIDMYVKYGSVEEARGVFDGLPNPDVVSWGAIISGYTQHGFGLLALEFYGRMQDKGIQPDKIRFLCVLRACSSIGAFIHGKSIHTQIVKSGRESDMAIGCSLVDMYAKCGSFQEAEKVFDGLTSHDVVIWGAMIGGYTQYGHDFSALNFFRRMRQDGIEPNNIIYVCILKVCGNLKITRITKLLHVDLLICGMELDTVGTTLVDSYAKCGSLEEAQHLFDRMPDRNVMLWSAIIAGYTHQGHSVSALKLFEKMWQEGVEPSKSIYTCIIKACGSTGSVEQGWLIHDQILRSRLEADEVVGSVLVDMYAKCGHLEVARKVFDDLCSRDLVSWGVMISGYAQHGYGCKALELFERMHMSGQTPDNVIFLCVLKACSSVEDVEMGQLIHDQIIRAGLQSDAVVRNTMIDMYAKCGCLDEARKVFEELSSTEVVPWSVMIAGYVQHHHGFPALELYEKMQQAGIQPDKVIFLCILKACIIAKNLNKGRLMHKQIISSGLEPDMVVRSALVDMYAKCGSLEDARKVFDESANHDVVTWGAMIAGYTDHGDGLSGLELFERMQQEGIMCNEVILISSLKACSSIGAVRHGKLIHNFLIQTGLDADIVLVSALIDMYGKCGNLKEAQRVFDVLLHPDVVSWGALIEGYAQDGDFRLALTCLDEMQGRGLKPHSVIYLSILSACSHAGLVEEGKRCFESMKANYGIKPNIDHFNCMIDLFSRSGRLKEAEQLLHSMPIPCDAVGWMSLLTACRIHGNMELGRHCFNEVAHLDPIAAAGYVLMSNIYADAQKYEDVHEIQVHRKHAGAWKKPGKAWIEVRNSMHEFIVGERAHPQSDEMHASWNRLKKMMKGAGYMPDFELSSEF